MPNLRQDDAGAASSVVAFLVAGVIFVGSVGAILIASRDTGGPSVGEPAESAVQSLQAQALADLILDSPGYYKATPSAAIVDWDGTVATSGDPEVVRLGLQEPGSTLMSFEKFQNLRRAGYAASATDGRVNYPEARQGLGLSGTDVDFHLRAFPSLKSVQELLAQVQRDPNLRVTYIADMLKQTSGGPDPGIADPTCTVGSDRYTFSTVVTNNGDTTTQFIARFKLDFDGGADYEDRSRSFELAPHTGTATLSVDVPAKAGRSCEAEVEIELRDPKSKILRRDWDLSASGTAATTLTRDLTANPSKTNYNEGEPVVLDFDGDLPTGNDPAITLQVAAARVCGATAAVSCVAGDVLPATSLSVDRRVRSYTMPAALFDADVTHDYVVTLTDVASGFSLQDRVVVLPAGAEVDEFVPAAATVSYTATTPVAHEVAFLEDLVDRFCPYYVDSTATSPLTDPALTYAGRCAFKATTPLAGAAPSAGTQPGDIVPDQQDVMNDDLPQRLIDPTRTSYVQQCNGNIVGGPRYDITRVLVVGSDVDHNAMTSGAAKHAVCEWVMDGGTLIVFGSDEQQAAWLQPIFHAAIRSSSGPVSTPDASHPVLNRADELAYDSYVNHGVWNFNGQVALAQETSELFTNVVLGGPDPVLTISNPGAFGDGTVILTTWLPYDLFGTGPSSSQLEGRMLVNNLLLQGYRDLFLDYGPEVPSSSRQAAAAQRVVEIGHPEFTSLAAECDRPELLYQVLDASTKECYDPITLTVFVYVF